MKRLVDVVLAKKLRSLAIIGLAKNAGKTVAFNTLVKEIAVKDLRLALLSYGRDGEEIDVITRQKKPRIFVPAGTFFVTATKAYAKSKLDAILVKKTGIKTLLGEVNIYRAQAKGGYIELVGINSTSRLEKIKNLLPSAIDLILIDGALDRRSSAMPSLSEGLVLSTGAVVGNTEEAVVKKTIQEIRKLTVPVLKELSLQKITQKLYALDKGGIITQDDCLIDLKVRISFASISQIKGLKVAPKAIILNGALTDSFLEELVFSLNIRDCYLIIKDGTRIFLNKRNFNLINKFNLQLRVLNPIEVLAVTVNPVSPYGIKLNSKLLVNLLRKELTGVLVYDLLSPEYLLK